jgi:hypothetical protein
MDEKTAALRDIFMDVAEDDTVTESQDDDRGSIAGADEDAVDERLRAVVDQLRDRYDFGTGLSTAALVAVVRGFYDGDDDPTIAAALVQAAGDGAAGTEGVDATTVFRARMDLHLVRDSDTDFPFEMAALRTQREADAADPTVSEIAAELDADDATVERALRVAETQDAIRRVSHRYQSAFEDAIPDTALSIRLTETVQDDGLDEAAEDIETNTSF